MPNYSNWQGLLKGPSVNIRTRLVLTSSFTGAVGVASELIYGY